jgi:glycosidase
MVFRVVSSPDVASPALLWGDPFDYSRDEKTGAHHWDFKEQSFYKQYALTPEAESNSAENTVLWQTELEVPPRRRLKYGIRFETKAGVFYASENGIVPYRAEEVNRNYNQFFFPFIHAVDAPPAPPWVETTLWYQIFPERFCNGNPAISPPHTADWEAGEPEHGNFFGGDLEGIRKKLSYLNDLGVNGIYLTPVFKAPSNHKYDTEDYFLVDEHFGTKDDLKNLVAEAHGLGMRVMLDAVFNHAGDRHRFWQDVLKNQEQSAYKDYFCIHGFPVKDPGGRGSYTSGRPVNYDCFAYSPRMPKWNTEHPAARKYLLDAAVYWIKECDIDAWRLDVSDEVSFNFWAEFSRAVRAAKKDFYIIGEMWHDASPWLEAPYFNAVMNYPLGFAVADFFLKKEIKCDSFNRRLFTALSRYSGVHNRLAFNLLDSHDKARALTDAHGDKQALRNAFTMLFLLPGSPCIYYGTEIGMEGGHDPMCRGPMVWNREKQDTELFAFFQKLIAFRKEYSGVIQYGAMSSSALAPDGPGDAIPLWTISYKGQALSIIYSGAEAVRTAGPESSLGGCVFGSTRGIIPSHSVAVFKK